MTKEQLNKNIGERVRSLREYHNFTRENLSEYSDISVQFLSDIENGRKSMTTTVLYKMCKALHVPSDYILFGKSETNNDSPITMMLSTVSADERLCAEHLLQNYIQGLTLREKHINDSEL